MDRGTTRDFPRSVAAHTVRNQKQADIVGPEKIVLVMVALQPDVCNAKGVKLHPFLCRLGLRHSVTAGRTIRTPGKSAPVLCTMYFGRKRNLFVSERRLSWRSAVLRSRSPL